MRILFFLLITLIAYQVKSLDSHPEATVAAIETQLLTLITSGDDFYKRKRFNDAITLYSQALSYFKSQDEETQKDLALTHHKIAQSYKQLKDRDQSIHHYKQALDIFTVFDDRESMARTLNNIAREERYRKNLMTALDYSIRSLEIQEEFNDPNILAKTLLGSGTIYRLIGRYEESLNHFLQAHHIYQKKVDVSGIAETSNQMGLIYTRLKKFDQARSFYQLTIDLPQEKVNPKNLAVAYREMAVIELNDGNYITADKMAKAAYTIYTALNDRVKSSIATRIIGDVYRDQKKYELAANYYQDSLEYAKAVDNKVYQIKALTRLAGTLIGKDTVESIRLFETSVRLSIEIGMKSEQLYAYRGLRKAEQSIKNYQQALNYAVEEIALTKIIQQENDEKELARTKAKLNSRKVELELASLKESAKLDKLELIKKNSEIEIQSQARQISDLKLIKNRYTNFALAFLLTGCFIAAVYIYRRFEDSRERNKELGLLVARDPLTNCYNRRGLFELMEKDFIDFNNDSEYCLIMADIDHFKEVNDTHGHIVGDTVLSSIAKTLQENVRQNDIVARFGGEEFCIVLPKTVKQQALLVADKLRKKIESNTIQNVAVTCSFGVTSIKFAATSPTELIDQADLALYNSKLHGRNQVTLWTNKFGEKEV